MDKMTASDRDSSLDLMRAVAILLVVNSHLDDFYPIPQLGTGGMFGNELFFFVSGYGLFLSFQKRSEPILPWLTRRIARVYEPLFVIATFLVLVGYIRVHTLSDFFWVYIISKEFWFLPAITALYVPIFMIISLVRTKVGFLYLFAGLAFTYILVFSVFAEKTAWITENFNVQTEVTLPLRIIYYFGTMVLGVYMARFHGKTAGNSLDLVWLVLSAAAYYLYVASLGHIVPFQLQILDRVPAVTFLLFAFRAAHYPPIKKFVSAYLGGLVALLASLTLQIYLVHGYILEMETVRTIAFPANIVVFAVATLAMAVFFGKLRFSRKTTTYNLQASAAVRDRREIATQSTNQGS
jgi:peptidoglycan/LPS O-acetylase OafA/YrhL